MGVVKIKLGFKKLRKLIYFAIIFIIIAIIVTQLIPVESSLKIFGFRPLLVVTDSMTGELNVMDMVVIKRTKLEKIEIGDIITFNPPEGSYAPDGLITHYVASIKKDGDGWIIHTKPGTSDQWDDWVLSEENVVGELWFKVPKIGYFVLALRDPLVIRNIVVIFIILFSISWIWPKKKEVAPVEDDVFRADGSKEETPAEDGVFKAKDSEKDKTEDDK